MPSFGRSTTLVGGGGGGGGIGGSGTAGKLAKFTAGTTLGDSLLSESGQDVTINTGRLVINRGTITALSPALDVATTWNNAAVTFTGLRYNVTDNASNAASLLMDLQVGGVSQFSVRKNGNVAGTMFRLNGATGAGIQVNSNANRMSLHSNSGEVAYLSGLSFVFESNTAFGWSPGAASSGAQDVVLARDAADTLAQRRTTNAQTFNVYNTFTSSTNHERGFLSWVSNEFRIGTEKGSGGGSARALVFQTDGVTRLTIGTTGAGTFAGFCAVAPGQYFDIGGRAHLRSPSASVVQLTNNTATDFDRLQFGGITSSFPALKRSSATLQARLADDSDFADFSCEQIRTNNGVFHVSDVALTDGAAAQTGTLTNAPAAGNPTKWIPINDNGTTRYIPCW